MNFNVKLPTIRQLQCFLAVAYELNFRRAAERMRMTQPPLTRQIQCLEDVIGCPLFTRDNHQVHLTDIGRQLEGQAKQLISQLTCLIKGLHVENEKVKVGMTRTLDFTQIPPLHNALEQLTNIAEISSHKLTSRQSLRMLGCGNLDMALVGETPTDNEKNFCFHSIHREPLMLAMPSSHPASIQESVALKEVADLPLSLYWFARSANPVYYDKCEAYLQQLPFILKRKSEPDDSLIMLANIARGKGMALMPLSMCVSTHEGLCYRRLDKEANEKLKINVYLAVRYDENRVNVLNARDGFLGSVALAEHQVNSSFFARVPNDVPDPKCI
ncbi:LysR family transcriptional regulator [Xenorhabdus bovienii]|uniref:LysR family transcriptional regulator n=1 Tax=Xenorhabdus bovienii TaxID=40576 RepID=UPI0023B25642|nr:LysR family transcriptional regulator [Xenorhabdus bovienii]MDE9555330.1 LysR family transcriptional regulator [Xenorhabdus bovienii]